MIALLNAVSAFYGSMNYKNKINELNKTGVQLWFVQYYYKN